MMVQLYISVYISALYFYLLPFIGVGTMLRHAEGLEGRSSFG
jgi:hypothetical protein